MKKIFLILAAALTLAACNDKVAEPINNIEDSLTVDSTSLANDYAKVFALTGDSTIKFYESQITLDSSLTADNAANPKAVSVVNIFQVADTVWSITHRVGEAPSIDHEGGFWLEDLPVNISRVNLSLDSALTRLYQADIVKPNTHMCVLRRPLYRTLYIDAFYIFGNIGAGFVSVDCNNAKVEDFNNKGGMPSLSKEKN